MPNFLAEDVRKVLRNPPPVPVEDVPPAQWAPERAPARATPLAPEGVESPLANWARRLIIGPRSLVEQTLREEAQTRRDTARSREAMALEGRRETRGRENLLLSIREGARVAEERAARERTEKRTYEQAQRDALAKVVGPRLSPMPTLGVGILSTGERIPIEGPQAPPYKPDLADLLPFEKGLEVHKALTEKEETGVQWDPTKSLVGPRTGRVIKPAETQATPTQPVPFVDYNPVTQEPFLDKGRWVIKNKAVTDYELLASEAARQFPNDQAKQEQWILSQSLERQKTIAGAKAGAGEAAKTREEEAARARLPLHRGYKDPVLVNRLTLANESIKAPTVGAADAMVMGGTHKLLTEDRSKVYRDGLEAISLAKDIKTIGERIFTGKTARGVAIRGVWVGVQSFTDLGLGKERNNLQQQMGRVMKLVRMLQGEARISDADLTIIGKFVSVDNLFQSAEGFKERIGLVERVVKEGMRRLVDDIVVAPDAGPTMEELQAVKPVDSKGRPIPAPTGERRFKVAP